MGDIELQVFADRLKMLRSDLNITQKDFAEKIGITAAALSSYENNLKNPSVAVAKRIAKTYNVSIDWLCGLSERIRSDDALQTYADVIDLLVRIEHAIKFEMDSQNTNCITICDSVMQCFFSDWNKTLPLYHDEVIDEKLYKLWVDNKIREFKNVRLGNKDDIDNFLILMDVVGSPILSMPKPSQDEPPVD